MLEVGKDANYFLFTASGEPVCFAIDDSAVKMTFRMDASK